MLTKGKEHTGFMRADFIRLFEEVTGNLYWHGDNWHEHLPTEVVAKIEESLFAEVVSMLRTKAEQMIGVALERYHAEHACEACMIDGGHDTGNPVA